MKRIQIEIKHPPQQILVLMKMSWRHLEGVIRLRLQKKSLRRLNKDVYFPIRLQKTASRRVQDVLIKMNIFVLVIRLQDVLPARLEEVIKTSCKNVFKTFLRLLQDVLERCLQDILKTFLKRIIKLNYYC